MLRQVNKSIFCHQRRLGKQALTFALQQGISEIVLTALAATQLAEVAAEELLADEALDKAHADLKHTKKKRQNAQKQVQQHNCRRLSLCVQLRVQQLLSMQSINKTVTSTCCKVSPNSCQASC